MSLSLVFSYYRWSQHTTPLPKRCMFSFEVVDCLLKLGKYVTENATFIMGFCLLNIKLWLYRLSRPRDISAASESGRPTFFSASGGSFLPPPLSSISFHRLALLDLLGRWCNWKLTWPGEKKKKKPRRILSDLVRWSPPWSYTNTRARTLMQLERRAWGAPEDVFWAAWI